MGKIKYPERARASKRGAVVPGYKTKSGLGKGFQESQALKGDGEKQLWY